MAAFRAGITHGASSPSENVKDLEEVPPHRARARRYPARGCTAEEIRDAVCDRRYRRRAAGTAHARCRSRRGPACTRSYHGNQNRELRHQPWPNTRDRIPGHGLAPAGGGAARATWAKAALINALCAGVTSCASTSATPGKTRLINVFLINGAFHLVDLPGYGFAKVDKQEKLRWGEMMQTATLPGSKHAASHVLHLVDIRHAPTADDVTMNQFLRQMGIPFTVIATKADKITRGARIKQLAPICRALLVQPWEIICFSSEDDTGREDLLALLEKLTVEQA